MSAPVDVLAVMADDALKAFVARERALGMQQATAADCVSAAARAAVAELIRVAQKAASYPPSAIGKPLHDEFCAALARVGGAA